MDWRRFVKEVADREGVSMGEIAGKMGISRQALYGRLRGRVSYETVERCLRELGYGIYYGKDGKVRRIE